MSESTQLDPAAITRLQKLGGDVFTGKMIDLFLDFGGQKVAAARKAFAEGNLSALEEAAHPLKSSAGNVGARQVQCLAQRVEQFAKEQRANDLGALVAELETAFQFAATELLRTKQSLTLESPIPQASPDV